MIARYERHLNSLEQSNNPSSQSVDRNLVAYSEFTDRESSSLQNPSSRYNHALSHKKEVTETKPVITTLTQSGVEVEDGTVKYNLTEKSSKSLKQTAADFLSESRLEVLEGKEKLRLKLRKKEKRERLLKQKINKLMFFFFTLQNKGVPVNEIYEQEGIKAIRTDRFDEIMAQIARENGDQP